MAKHAFIILFFIVRAIAADAVPAPEGELWYDHAHGLVMMLPAGVTVIDDPIDEALIRFTSPKSQGDYSIHAIVKKNAKRKTIQQLVERAKAEVAITSVEPSIIESPRYIKLGGRKAAIIYYRHEDRNQQVIARVFKKAEHKQRPWIMGQALILLPSQLNPGVERMPSERLLIVQMTVDVPFFNQGKTAFESMLATLQIDDPKALTLTRMEQVNASTQWLNTLTFDQWRKACKPRQLFGIQKDGVDIGYMRIQQVPATELKQQGLSVTVEARVIENGHIVVTEFKTFWSADDNHEFWSKKINERPEKAPVSAKIRRNAGTTWTETGVRHYNHINVVRHGPAGSKTYEWQKPRKGYISQVQMHLLGQMFKTAPKGEMGFYVYFSSSNSISYRSERIEQNKSGTYRVLSRPNLKKAQFVSIFNRDGLMQSQQLPDGTVLVAMTKKQLAARWKHNYR